MTPRKKSHHQDRNIRVRAVRKDNPDLRKFAQAVIALAQAQAEAEAQAEHEHEPKSPSKGDAPGQKESA